MHDDTELDAGRIEDAASASQPEERAAEEAVPLADAAEVIELASVSEEPIAEEPLLAAAGAEGVDLTVPGLEAAPASEPEAPVAPTAELVPLPFDEEPTDAPPLEPLAESADVAALDALLASLDEDVAGSVEASEDVPTATADGEEPRSTPEEAEEAPLAEVVPLPAADADAPADSPVRGFDVPEQRPYTPWIPFAAYAVAWVAFAVAAFVLFRSAGTPGEILGSERYGFMVWGGVVLAAIGPVLGVVAYVVGVIRVERERRDGLFARVVLLASGSTLLGVALWALSLYLLDALRAAS